MRVRGGEVRGGEGEGEGVRDARCGEASSGGAADQCGGYIDLREDPKEGDAEEDERRQGVPQAVAMYKVELPRLSDEGGGELRQIDEREDEVGIREELHDLLTRQVDTGVDRGGDLVLIEQLLHEDGRRIEAHHRQHDGAHPIPLLRLGPRLDPRQMQASPRRGQVAFYPRASVHAVVIEVERVRKVRKLVPLQQPVAIVIECVVQVVELDSRQVAHLALGVTVMVTVRVRECVSDEGKGEG